ncbi:MAG: OB-fold domain-containing protein [Natrialbaceae archaeon]|nr:OB-fold domain-containing protein [Natrialbaceae archaeon]
MMDRWEPRPVPEVTPETEPFWAGAAAGEYRLQECQDCGQIYGYTRAVCPDCGSLDVEWTVASGEGTVYSYAVLESHRTWPESALPMICARVDLAEGVQVVTNLVDCSPEDVAVGDTVQVAFVPTDDEAVAVPVFTLEE